jgi:hypothetical protein
VSQQTPHDEFLKAIMNAAEACAKHGETLIQTNDPERQRSIRMAIYMEYAVLFLTIGIREARKLKVPNQSVWQLVLVCFEGLTKKVHDGVLAKYAVPATEADQADGIKQIERNLTAKAQAMDKYWNSLTQDDAKKFEMVFDLAGKEALAKCERSGEWEQLKAPLMQTAIDAWQSALFVKVLRPLVAVN